MLLPLKIQFDMIIYAFIAGFIIGIFFDIYRIIRGKERIKIISILQDVLFWILCSIIVFIFIKDINIVLVVTVSLFINMIVGAMIGGFMPILFKKLDADPSIISAPVIATVLDITGITIYLVTTTIILSKIV